jgi:hypothetical protein
VAAQRNGLQKDENLTKTLRECQTRLQGPGKKRRACGKRLDRTGNQVASKIDFRFVSTHNNNREPCDIGDVAGLVLNSLRAYKSLGVQSWPNCRLLN